MAWFRVEIVFLIISGLMCFFPPVRPVGIILFFVFLAVGFVIIFHNYKENSIETAEVRAIRIELNQLYAEFKKHTGDKGATLAVLAKDKTGPLKYGGALYFRVVINGINKGGSYLLDYGGANNLTRNRVYLYVNDDRTISMVLYDAEGKEYCVTSTKSVKINQSYIIACLWNKKYGDLILFIDNEIMGKASVKPLNMEPVVGELAVGNNLSGNGQGSIIAQEVAVFAFNP